MSEAIDKTGAHISEHAATTVRGTRRRYPGCWGCSVPPPEREEGDTQQCPCVLRSGKTVDRCAVSRTHAFTSCISVVLLLATWRLYTACVQLGLVVCPNEGAIAVNILPMTFFHPTTPTTSPFPRARADPLCFPFSLAHVSNALVQNSDPTGTQHNRKHSRQHCRPCGRGGVHA